MCLQLVCIYSFCKKKYSLKLNNKACKGVLHLVDILVELFQLADLVPVIQHCQTAAKARQPFFIRIKYQLCKDKQWLDWIYNV